MELLRQRQDQIEERLGQAEERLRDLEANMTRAELDLSAQVAKIEVSVASLSGRMLGYLTAATLMGGIILFIAQLLMGHVASGPR